MLKLLSYRIGQIYLPPFTKASLSFMGGILRGEKRCFNNTELRPRVVPSSKMLTVERILSEMRDDRELFLYLPEVDFDKKIFPPR